MSIAEKLRPAHVLEQVARSRRSWWPYAALAVIVVASGFLRFVNLANAPGYEWDETVYNAIGNNVVEGRGVVLGNELSHSVSPYLFHPPFYFLLLGKWFAMFGSGVTEARALGVLSSLIVIVLVFFLMKLLKNDAVAVVTAAIVSIDTWVVFTNRVSWIENSQMVIILLAMIMLALACRTNKDANWKLYVAAGLLIGLAVIFKNTAAFLFLVLIFSGVVNRSREKYHYLALSVALSVAAIYVAVMTIIFGGAFINSTLAQVLRTSGATSSRGSLGNPADFIEPLVSTYRIFAATVIVAGIGIVLLMVRIIRAYRNRSLKPLGNNLLLGSWVLSAVAFFSVISLKMPHYFILTLLPLICFVVAEFYDLSIGRKNLKRVLVAGLAVLVLANAYAYSVRIIVPYDNPVKQVAQYMDTQVSHDAIVVADQTVGVAIPQKYCTIEKAVMCASNADYVVTYVSFTQKLPLYEPSFKALTERMTKVVSFIGFRENVTVWKVKHE